MVSKEFISEIKDYKTISLGSTERAFLLLILVGNSSAYKIFLHLKNPKLTTLKPMAYKNVHKRVKRLLSLGLIEELDEKFKRNAINYRLTSRGIFQYLLTGNTIPFLLNKYQDKNNVIIQTILYQFFEEETMSKFLTMPRYFSLGDYLRKCCEGILKKLEEYRSRRFKTDLRDEIDTVIQNEIKNFVFYIIMNIRETTVNYRLLDAKGREYKRMSYDVIKDNWAGNDGKDHSSFFPNMALATDKKFIKLLLSIKKDFEDGCKELL